jgi:hypothetical protein
MGLSDLAAKVLFSMKMDTTDYKQKVRELQAEEKRMAQAQVEALDRRNKGYESAIAGIGKVAVAIGAVAAAWSVAKSALKTYEENSRLAAVTAGISMERLRATTRGLRSDTQLAQLAQQGLSGAMKLSENQINVAAKAIDGFRARGYEMEKAAEAVGQAINTGSIRPLKELGINLDLAKGKGEQFTQVMDVLGGVSRDAGKNVDSQNEAVQRAGVQWANSMDQIKDGIARLVFQMQPFLTTLTLAVAEIGKLAELSRGLGGGAGLAGSVGRVATRGIDMTLASRFDAARPQEELFNEWLKEYQAGRAGGDFDRWMRERRAVQDTSAALSSAMGGMARAGVDASLQTGFAILTQQGVQAGMDKQRAQWEAAAKKIGSGDQEFILIHDTRSGTLIPVFGFDGNFGQGASASSLSRVLGDMPTGPEMGLATDAGTGWAAAAQMESMLEKLDLWRKDQRDQEKRSILAQVFGEPKEFDLYAEKMQMLGGVVGVFTNALTQSFQAWISGSMSAAEAVKAFPRAVLQGIATTMWAKSMEHGAAVIGSIAIQNYAGAAMHGKAAAAYGAGAIAVGAAARAFGGGGAAGGAYAGGSAPGAGATHSQTNVTIVYDSAGGRSDRWRARDVAEDMARADRYRSGDTVVYR